MCSGILLSHKEEPVRVSWTEGDEPGACHKSEVRKESNSVSPETMLSATLLVFCIVSLPSP